MSLAARFPQITNHRVAEIVKGPSVAAPRVIPDWKRAKKVPTSAAPSLSADERAAIEARSGSTALFANPAVKLAGNTPEKISIPEPAARVKTPVTGKIFDAPSPVDVDVSLTGLPQSFADRAGAMVWVGTKALVTSLISLALSPVAVPAGLFMMYLAKNNKIATTGSGGLAYGFLMFGLLFMPMMAVDSIKEFIAIARGTMADPKKALGIMTDANKPEKERLAAFTRLRADYPNMTLEQRAAFTRATAEMIASGLRYDANKETTGFLEVADVHSFIDSLATRMVKQEYNTGSALSLCERIPSLPTDKRAIAFDHVLKAAEDLAEREIANRNKASSTDKKIRELYTNLAFAVADDPTLRDECVLSYLNRASRLHDCEDANVARLLFEHLGKPKSLAAPVAKLIRDTADGIDPDRSDFYVRGPLGHSYLPAFKDRKQSDSRDWLQSFVPGHVASQRLNEWADAIEGKPVASRHTERLFDLVEDEFGVEIVETAQTPAQEIEIRYDGKKLGTLNSALLNQGDRKAQATFAVAPHQLEHAVKSLLRAAGVDTAPKRRGVTA